MIMTSDKLKSGKYSAEVWMCYRVTQSIKKLKFTGRLIRLSTKSGKCRKFDSDRLLGVLPDHTEQLMEMSNYSSINENKETRVLWISMGES
jgi:hypothetical protein